MAARGVGRAGQYGKFTAQTNAGGGTVWTSDGVIRQLDFHGIVTKALYQGEDVTILSGVHGFADGAMVRDLTLFADDVAKFGNIPGIRLLDVNKLAAPDISGILNSPGTTIGGFCYSGACLAQFW